MIKTDTKIHYPAQCETGDQVYRLLAEKPGWYFPIVQQCLSQAITAEQREIYYLGLTAYHRWQECRIDNQPA